MLVNERNPNTRDLSFDSAAALKEAQAKLPLDRLIEQYGHAPKNGNWKSMDCPFCSRKQKAGLFRAEDGAQLFKCHSTSCSTGATAMDAVGFIASKGGMSRRDAFVEYLKMANVWRDRAKLKSSTEPEKISSGSGRHTPGAPSSEGEPVPPAEQHEANEAAPSRPLSTAGVELALPLVSEFEGGSELQPDPDVSPSELFSGPAAGTGGSPPLSDGAITSPAASHNQSNPSGSAEAAGPDPNVPLEGGRPAAERPVEPVTPPPPQARSEAAAEPEKETAEPKAQDNLEPGLASLRAFYARLLWSVEDERKVWEKRALTSATCQALCYRSNPRANEILLQELADRFEWDELYASGLWLPPDRKLKLDRRPNQQFMGKGQMGKKPKEERRSKEDKWTWGFCEPVLIPYFNSKGELIKLRPHKGGAPSGTICGASRIYVPRAVGSLNLSRSSSPALETADEKIVPLPGAVGAADGGSAPAAAMAPERFDTVVICEGEFKAAALWQTLGAGRLDGRRPYGVCAIPGINFGKNIDLREELDNWLSLVGCRMAIVAFDDEDKSDRPIRERYDATIWAKYLAIDISRKLHIATKVCILPQEWRNDKGKADWDGALAKIVHGTKPSQVGKVR